MVNNDPGAGGAPANTPGGASALARMGVSDGSSGGHKAMLNALRAAGRRMYHNGQVNGGLPVNQAHAPDAGRALSQGSTQDLSSVSRGTGGPRTAY